MDCGSDRVNKEMRSRKGDGAAVWAVDAQNLKQSGCMCSELVRRRLV